MSVADLRKGRENWVNIRAGRWQIPRIKIEYWRIGGQTTSIVRFYSNVSPHSILSYK